MKKDAGRKETDKILEEMEKKIAAEYKQAEREIADKLDEYLKKFEKKDAQKRAAVQKGLIAQKEYEQWRTGQIMIGKRWEEMRDTLAKDYQNANNIAKSTINGYMPEVYALNHNYGTFEVESQSGIDTSYTLYDRQTVERLMRDNPDLLPPAGKKVSQAIAEGKAKRWNKQHIQSVMMQSLLQGEAIPNIAKRLAKKVGDSNYKAAIRNARTMTTSAECAGRVDSYKRADKMGIEMQQQWIATLDSRTRDSHVAMDGETVDVGKRFSNGLRYPADPTGRPEEVWNCRCTLVAQLKGFETDASDLGLRRSEKLKGMSYEEWKGEHYKPPVTSNAKKPTDADLKAQEKAKKQADKRFKNKNQPVSTEYEKSLQEKYNRGTDLGRKLFDKYIKYGGQVVDGNSKDAYFQSGQVYLNYAKDAKNPRGAGTTWFHEHGHFIDWFTVRKVNIGGSKAFRDAIMADARALEKARASKYSGSIDDIRKGISKELTSKGDVTHSIQDLLGGSIDGVYPKALYGHSEKGYWTKDPDHLQKEACAHMFEAQFEPEKIKLMEEYFPSAWKMFNEKMKGLVK